MDRIIVGILLRALLIGHQANPYLILKNLDNLTNIVPAGSFGFRLLDAFSNRKANRVLGFQKNRLSPSY